MHRVKIKHRKPNVKKNSTLNTFSDMCPERFNIGLLDALPWLPRHCEVVGSSQAIASFIIIKHQFSLSFVPAHVGLLEIYLTIRFITFVDLFTKWTIAGNKT